MNNKGLDVLYTCANCEETYIDEVDTCVNCGGKTFIKVIAVSFDD